MQTFKRKLLRLDPPQFPTFEAAGADALEAQNWEELDCIVRKGNIFVAHFTVEVIGLNGHHTVPTASNGTRYLSVMPRTSKEPSAT